KASCPVDRRADLWTGVLQIRDALVGFLAHLELLLEGGDRLRVAGEQARVGNAAAFLHETRRGDVLQAHEQRRREIDELRALIRTVIEHLRHRELGRADADAVAEPRAELRNEPRLEPCLART